MGPQGLQQTDSEHCLTDMISLLWTEWSCWMNNGLTDESKHFTWCYDNIDVMYNLVTFQKYKKYWIENLN